jgi:hypothetical protein
MFRAYRRKDSLILNEWSAQLVIEKLRHCIANFALGARMAIETRDPV